MGKSYSYSIVVEQAGDLFMNEVEVPLPQEVVAADNDPLGWALEQVRAIYASKFKDDPSSELNLSVRDRRPGGLVRRARFTHPDSGIDLDTFLAPRTGRGRASSAIEHPLRESDPLPSVERPEAEVAPERPQEDSSAEHALHDEPASTVGNQLRTASESTHRNDDLSSQTQEAQRKTPTHEQPTTGSTAFERKVSEVPSEDTYEEKVRKERGWKKLDRNKSNRPQVGSAENEGRSRSLGLLELGKKQKTRNIIAIVVVVIVVIVGFRVFNGGTDYDAVCVDQRTMTRAVTGVACEAETDTNHRWWYMGDVKNLPGVGDTIDTQAGTFDEPKGAKDTISYHVENVDEEES